MNDNTSYFAHSNTPKQYAVCPGKYFDTHKRKNPVLLQAEIPDLTAMGKMGAVRSLMAIYSTLCMSIHTPDSINYELHHFERVPV